MNVRFATIEDVHPALWFIIEDYHEKLTRDDLPFEPEDLLELAASGKVIAVTDAEDYPVGMALLTDRYEDLHATIHFALRPKYFKQALRTALFERVIDFVFEHYKVGKLNAEIPLRYNQRRKVKWRGKTTAYKIVRKLDFKPLGFRRKHVKMGGNVFDLYLFELHRSHWEGRKQADEVA